MRKATSLFVIAVLAVLLGAQLVTAQVVVTVGSQPLGVVSIGETDFRPLCQQRAGGSDLPFWAGSYSLDIRELQ